MDMVERLENYRLENKISQQALAKKLGVAFSTVNRWFNRHIKPNKIQRYHIEKLIKQSTKHGKKSKTAKKGKVSYFS